MNLDRLRSDFEEAKNDEVPLVYRNYKELCAVLEEEIKKGNSKTAQMKEWEKYFKFEKEEQGNVITVFEIYDTPIIKDLEKEKINNSYMDNFRISLAASLLELAREENKKNEGIYRFVLPKNKWFDVIGMCGNRYKTAKRELDKHGIESGYLQYLFKQIKEFENSSDKEKAFFLNESLKVSSQKMNSVFTYAINAFANKKMLMDTQKTFIVIDSKGIHREANDKDMNECLKASYNALEEMKESEKTLYIKPNKIQEYYDKRRENIQESSEGELTDFYEVVEITYSIDLCKQFLLSHNALDAEGNITIDISETKNMLNENIVKGVCKAIGSRYKTNQEKSSYKYGNDYVCKTSELSKKLLKREKNQ